jgi:hypothetical protein
LCETKKILGWGQDRLKTKSQGIMIELLENDLAYWAKTVGK